MSDIEGRLQNARVLAAMNHSIGPTVLASLDELWAEVERLRQRLLTAAGDDLCRLTQEEIKAMSAGDVPIPPKEEFLASCERFHAQVAGEVGVNQNCLTLAQLIAENERLREYTEACDSLIESQNATITRMSEEEERLRAALKALLEIDEIKFCSHGAVFVASSLVQDC